MTYDDSTLPTGSTTTTLFSSVTAFPGKRFCAQAPGMERFVVDLVRSHPGTLSVDRSSDRGVTWQNVLTTADGRVMFSVADYDDFRVQWINGGTTQTSWKVAMSFIHDRAAQE